VAHLRGAIQIQRWLSNDENAHSPRELLFMTRLRGRLDKAYADLSTHLKEINARYTYNPTVDQIASLDMEVLRAIAAAEAQLIQVFASVSKILAERRDSSRKGNLQSHRRGRHCPKHQGRRTQIMKGIV
jgi:hypothetical protein